MKSSGIEPATFRIAAQSLKKKNYAITHTGALMGREVFLENVD